MVSLPVRHDLSVDDYVDGVRARELTVLARAITLVESNRPAHQDLAQEVLARLLPETGGAIRVGVTGVPGVGKSTFIEALGARLTEQGHRLAVLAVDPSSSVSGGSIMGDKTRMTELARNPRAFVRPSPSGGSLGGVTRKTRETILLCEAAGFDVVLVETVGVGQSEAIVASMVDSLLLLLLPGAGDELQGIKRGLLELVDVMAVNKADGDNVLPAKRARAHYEAAMRYIRHDPAWQPPVLTVSALEGTGLDALWKTVEAHRTSLETRPGENVPSRLDRKRREQRRAWLWSLLEGEVLDRFRRHRRVADKLRKVEMDVLDGTTPPTRAARELLGLFFEE